VVTVKIVKKSDGKPVKDKKVSVSTRGVGLLDAAGQSSDKVRTDSEGEAHFQNIRPSNGKIYIDGSIVYEGKIEGRVVVYI